MQLVSTRLFQILKDIEGERLIGESTSRLEGYVRRRFTRYGFTSAMEAYRGYPSVVSVSVNDVAVHGVPGTATVNRGDLITVDIAARYDGFVGDAAWTFLTPGVSRRNEHFLHSAWRAFRHTVIHIKSGMTVRHIGEIAAAAADAEDISAIPEFVGHGIGRDLHEPPIIPFRRATGDPSAQHVRLRPGMIINIEPVYSIGAPDVSLHEDGWGYRLIDGSVSAHFELSLLLTANETRVLQMGGIAVNEIPQELPFGFIAH